MLTSWVWHLGVLGQKRGLRKQQRLVGLKAVTLVFSPVLFSPLWRPDLGTSLRKVREEMRGLWEGTPGIVQKGN